MQLDSAEDHFSLLDDDEWGTQLPADGFTDLGPSQRPFLLAMIHQMHCLDVIRVGFVTNRTGSAQHITHCLRYLRQTILCKADTTLEETMFEYMGDGWHAGASGVGMIHRCRDWTAVWKYLREYPSKNSILNSNPTGRWLHSKEEKGTL
ncbi:hypothetical protein B0F90DRAFT_1736757 [Multifurca ochricompacta]|uniref:Uncharacterized protein n=1 Tax=Multifurca ochricompacta TaxID=376703 RepID=A0AAD4LXT6_9AGAM|nr:hypothetical protein B0F90DRAFT_1769228 [Multifurca ochricompacta]KAI0297894.1 hypothetical protein B0F90DRAFT_1736757 [Multifurca ochricompacta]